MATNSVLVVGGGLTGAATVHFLTRRIPALSIDVWERSSQLGGRMTTYRHPSLGPAALADLGAQYITTQSNDFNDIYDHLLSQGTLIDLPFLIKDVRNDHYTKKHYTAPKGIGNVVETLFGNVPIHYNHSLTSLSLSRDGNKWLATSSNHLSSSDEGSTCQEFDHVHLCIPPPALLQIKGNWIDILTESQGPSIIDKLKSAQYSTRFAVTVIYPAEVREALASTSWTARYVYDDSVIRYYSLESKKFRISTKSKPKPEDVETLLIHTTVPFGIENQSKNEDEIKDLVMTSLPYQLPTLKSFSPLAVEVTNWKYSQVSKPNQVPLIPTIVKTGSARLSISSDVFTESNFEGCLRSAFYSVESLLQVPSTAIPSTGQV